MARGNTPDDLSVTVHPPSQALDSEQAENDRGPRQHHHPDTRLHGREQQRRPDRKLAGYLAAGGIPGKSARQLHDREHHEQSARCADTCPYTGEAEHEHYYDQCGQADEQPGDADRTGAGGVHGLHHEGSGGNMVPLAATGAMHCPADMGKIDEALAQNPQLSEEQLAEVRKYRAEGEELHKAGRHRESVDTLAKALKILGQ